MNAELRAETLYFFPLHEAKPVPSLDSRQVVHNGRPDMGEPVRVIRQANGDISNKRQLTLHKVMIKTVVLFFSFSSQEPMHFLFGVN